MAAPARDEESLAALGRSIVEDATRLARLEIEVAKAQAIASLKRGALAIALFVVASLMLLLMAVFALAALPERFSSTLVGDSWKGWGLTAAAFLVIAVLFALLGLRVLRRTIGATKTTLAGIKGDAEWVRQLPRRNRHAQ